MTFRETSGRHNIQKVHMQGQPHYFNGRYMKEVKRGKSTSVSFSPPKDSIKFKVIVIQINQWNRAQAFLNKKSIYQRTTWDSNESGPLVRTQIVFNVYCYFIITIYQLETKSHTKSSEICSCGRKLKENPHVISIPWAFCVTGTCPIPYFIPQR